MTLGPVGNSPEYEPRVGQCARCGRRIGAHLAYPEPRNSRAGDPGARLCYRCHRLATTGHVPRSLEEVDPQNAASAGRFFIFRLAAVFVACATFLVVRQTGQVSHFLLGLGGVILFFTLSAAARPGRRWRKPEESTPPSVLEEPPQSDSPPEQGPIRLARVDDRQHRW